MQVGIRNAKEPAVVIADHGIIEYFSGDGLYGAIEAGEDILFRDIVVESGVSRAFIYEAGITGCW